MKALIIRNMKVFFRDKVSVFFSLMAVFIIFALYLLFLGDVWASSLPKVEGVHTLMDSWLMSGVLAVASMTTVLGAFGTMVEDRANKIVKDFKASPVGRGRLVAGYELSAFLIGSIMSMLAFILAETYIVARGGALLPPLRMLEAVGLILLSALSNTAFLSLIVSFIKTQNAFGTLSSIVGTLVGFLTGVYLPIGILPDAIQFLIKIIPLSHSALLLRQVMIADSLQQVFGSLPPAIGDSFQQEMGVVFRFGGQAVPTYVSLLIIAGSGVLFYLLSILRFSTKAEG